MIYSVSTRQFNSLADLDCLPEGEVLEFLKEWFNDKDYIYGHTSGSTGTPKEIRLNKADMRASARVTNDFLGIREDSVLLLCLSVSYIAGKMMVVRALEAGAELLVCRVSSRPLKEWPGDSRIDLAAMVPMQAEESLGHPEEKTKLCNIRQLLIGGAPVSSVLEKQLQTVPVRCYATYGMTETVSHVALRKLGEAGVYFALGGVTFSLDNRGCLVVHVPYLQARKFVTNDLAEVIDSRHFRWLGRYDYVINSGGIKFSPEVIESKISACISCRYFITSLPDERLGQRIVLVIEGEKKEEEEKLLLEAMRKVLTPYEFTREIIYLFHFYETASGKIVRKLKCS